MSKVEFIYEGQSTIIHTEPNENMNNIVQKFFKKSKTQDLSDSMCFLYSGSQLSSNSNNCFKEIANKEDRERNQMTIIVDNYDKKEEIKLVQSKKVICPICKEICKLNIYDYKISLYGCKNNHKISNIFFKDFTPTQMTDETKITCKNCEKANITNTYQNLFYICRACGENTCPLCKEKNHNSQSHICIEYNQKDNICPRHNGVYVSYCKTCKTDICMSCEREHFYHDKITFGTLLLNKDLLKSKIEQLNENLNKLKNDSGEIKSEKLIGFINNIEIFIDISKFFMDNFDDKKLNFFTLNNINVIHLNIKSITDELKKINDETNIENKTKIINDIYDKMILKEEYKNEEDKDNDKIYPEEHPFLYPHDGYDYYDTYQNWHHPHDFPPYHGPHELGGPHWPYEWNFHHPPHHHGPYAPHGSHDPHRFHGPHGPHWFHGPHDHNGPHWFHGPHGPHDPHGPHGPYDQHGPHRPHEPHGPYHQHGPHEPHGFHVPHFFDQPPHFHVWFECHGLHWHHFGPHIPQEPNNLNNNNEEQNLNKNSEDKA